MNTQRKTSRLALSMAPVLIASLLSGCGGGMIGSGTGPKGNTEIDNIKLRYLPSRVGPRLPKSLTNSNVPRLNDQRAQGRSMPENDIFAENNSQNWRVLSPVFTSLDAQRLKTQSELIVLDSIFENVISLCVDGQTQCEVHSDYLSGTLNDNVVRQLTQLQQSGFSDESIAQAGIDLTTLQDRQVIFGRVQYSRGTDIKYDHQLVIRPLVLSPRQSLIIDWKDDDATVSYQLIDLDGLSNGEIFYTFSDRGQQLNYRSADIPMYPEPNLVMKIVGSGTDDGFVGFDVLLDEMNISGRASDLEGYGYTVDGFQSASGAVLTAEHFSTSGSLLDEDQCVNSVESDVDCLALFEQRGNTIFMNTTSLPSEVDLGLGTVTIADLPATTGIVEVRSGPLGTPFEEQIILCEGWSPLHTEGELEVVCFEDISHLINVSVVSRDEFGNLTPLRGARVLVNGRELGTSR